MLAVAEDIYIFDNDHVIRTAVELEILIKGLAEHLGNLMIGIIHPVKYFCIHTCHTLGGVFESLSVRVISQSDEDPSDMLADGVLINSHMIVPPYKESSKDVRRLVFPDPR